MTRWLVTLSAAIALVFALAGGAVADQVYHSEHVALSPVGGSPLRSGFVENIHPNGPVVFAHEIYVLNGATPTSEYQVTLLIYTDSTCSSLVAAVDTAILTTNTSGNGRADVFFPPEVADGLHGQTVGVRWELARLSPPQAPVLAYSTGCRSVKLD
jgi:hypothetical protein